MPGCRRGIPTGRTAWRPGRESRIMTCAGQGTPLLPALQGTAGRRRRCRRKLMDQIYLPVAKTVIRQHRIPFRHRMSCPLRDLYMLVVFLLFCPLPPLFALPYLISCFDMLLQAVSYVSRHSFLYTIPTRGKDSVIILMAQKAIQEVKFAI